MVGIKYKPKYISNDAMRRLTFKMRKTGMLKKITELTTLCGVEACAIIYENSNTFEAPTIWPSPMGVQTVLSKFCNQPRLNRPNKVYDMQSYMKERIKKAKEQLMKRRRENRQKELTLHMHAFLQSGVLPHSSVDQNDLANLADQMIMKIDGQLEKLKMEEEEEKMKMMNLASSSSSSFVPASKENNQNYVLVEDGNGFMRMVDVNVLLK